MTDLPLSFGASSNRRETFVGKAFDYCIEAIAPCPWATLSASPGRPDHAEPHARRPLYSPAERVRRDTSGWTIVQAILAPIQFVVFLVSLVLVVNFLMSGNGYEIATASVIVKTLVLFTIMVTGAIWEKAVFGQYLFAPAFFWEDTVSMLVIALHTAYVAALLDGAMPPQQMMLIALAAYVAYLVNAAQFVLKLRSARLDAALPAGRAG